MPLGSSRIVAPNFDSSDTVVLILSDSLKRNSPASSIVEVPSAKHAARAKAGISSISPGINSLPMLIERNSLDSIVKSQTGSCWFK